MDMVMVTPWEATSTPFHLLPWVAGPRVLVETDAEGPLKILWGQRELMAVR